VLKLYTHRSVNDLPTYRQPHCLFGCVSRSLLFVWSWLRNVVEHTIYYKNVCLSVHLSYSCVTPQWFMTGPPVYALQLNHPMEQRISFCDTKFASRILDFTPKECMKEWALPLLTAKTWLILNTSCKQCEIRCKLVFTIQSQERKLHGYQSGNPEFT